ncbi:MAG: hypothetical protein PWP69_1866 [Enterococcus sp.]|nr:hypothetical protein [Enterococcus sp.]
MRRYLLFLSKEENSLTVTSYKNRCKPCVPKDRRILWSLKNVVCGGFIYQLNFMRISPIPCPATDRGR